MKLYLVTIVNRQVVNGHSTDPMYIKCGVVAESIQGAVRLAGEYYEPMDWEHYVIQSIRESPLALLT